MPKPHNGYWRLFCVIRAHDLINKYGHIVCEYSGETVSNITPDTADLDAAWGLHIDGNAANYKMPNCYLVKHRYAARIRSQGIKVNREDFQGAAEIPQPKDKKLTTPLSATPEPDTSEASGGC